MNQALCWYLFPYSGFKSIDREIVVTASVSFSFVLTEIPGLIYVCSEENVEPINVSFSIWYYNI